MGQALAISPTGKLALEALLRGNAASKSACFCHRHGSVVARRIDGQKMTATHEKQVRGVPEGVVFSQGGRHVYVGDFID